MINYVQPPNQDDYILKWRQLPGGPPWTIVVDFEGSIYFDSKLTYLDAISEWSDKYNCGRRLETDRWEFGDEKDLMLFLLKWDHKDVRI